MRSWGVQRAYWDVTGRWRRSPPEAVRAVEEALQVDPKAPVPVLEPVVVAWGGRVRIPLRVMDHLERVACAVELEDGGELGWRVLPVVMQGPGQARVRLPGRLPLGAHRLRVAAGQRRWETVVLSAPRRLPPATPPAWGVWVPPHALWSWEEGGPNFQLLLRVARWLRELGGGVLGTLPLYAALLDEPCEPSPYLPATRLFWNEFLVYTGPEGSRSARPELTDYRQAYLHHKSRLVRMWRTCPDGQRGEVEAWARRQPWLSEYAAFRALLDYRRCPWRQWPEPYRSGRVPEGATQLELYGAYVYGQWLASRQLAGVASEGVWLYLDLPLGVHADGFDTWRFRGLFADGVSVGAPPDPFSPRGQDWGFPPPHPERSREGGHAYLRACLAQAFQVGRMLRLDHVMALHRLYWIPRGFPATEGVYVRYPTEELYAAVLLEAARAGAVVVGEDLGTVPGEVRRALDRRGLWRMYVLPFELRARGPREPPANGVASLGTHDTPTFAAFWQTLDVAERQRLGILDARAARRERRRGRAQVRSLARWLHVDPGDREGAFRALLRWLGGSPAGCVLVALEDLWGETLPHHLPGVAFPAYPNWRRPVRYPLEQWMHLKGVYEALAELRQARERRTAR